MLGNINIQRLLKAKEDLDDLKNIQLVFVAEKHVDDDYDFHDLLLHFRDEVREFDYACSHRASEGLLRFVQEELADLSNMIDLMFEYTQRLMLRQSRLDEKNVLVEGGERFV